MLLELAEQLEQQKTKTMTFGNTLLFAGKHGNEKFYLIETSRDITIALPIFKFESAIDLADKMIQLEQADISLIPSYWHPSILDIRQIIDLDKLTRLI